MKTDKQVINPLPPEVQECIDSYGRYYAEQHNLGMSVRDDMKYVASVAIRSVSFPRPPDAGAFDGNAHGLTALLEENKRLKELAERQMNDAEAARLELAELKQRIGASRKLAEKLQAHLTGMLVASCNCDTKTPDVEHHEQRCRYRQTSEAVELIDTMLANEPERKSPFWAGSPHRRRQPNKAPMTKPSKKAERELLREACLHLAVASAGPIRELCDRINALLSRGQQDNAAGKADRLTADAESGLHTQPIPAAPSTPGTPAASTLTREEIETLCAEFAADADQETASQVRSLRDMALRSLDFRKKADQVVEIDEDGIVHGEVSGPLRDPNGK